MYISIYVYNNIYIYSIAPHEFVMKERVTCMFVFSQSVIPPPVQQLMSRRNAPSKSEVRDPSKANSIVQEHHSESLAMRYCFILRAKSDTPCGAFQEAENATCNQGLPKSRLWRATTW